MDDFLKVLLIGLMVVYVISPVDACPGPIDDMVVMLIGMAASKRLANNNE